MTLIKSSFFNICLARKTLATIWDIHVEIPAPTTPNLGNPNRPYISTALPKTLSKFTLKFIFIGVLVFPVPRSTAAIDKLKA